MTAAERASDFVFRYVPSEGPYASNHTRALLRDVLEWVLRDHERAAVARARRERDRQRGRAR